MSGGELTETAEPARPRESQADPASAMTELEALQKALTDAEQRANGLRDQYLRSVAELDNVRKRAQRDVESATRYGLEKFAAELLPVMDSLALGVATASRTDAGRQGGAQDAESALRAMAEGQEATLKLLGKAFDKLNIKEIDPLGEPFDPARHEAMLVQDSATAEPGTVLQVVQRGYELNGRLLRPARVIVSRSA